ncbi:hypothetical protein FD755_010368 [Muntiacus reevesi]|uniref:Uncharacterized protein n=2 Tax=Muntiacus TaxID=9885 RepID=A0A5N3XY51_MUNRE|nr:hypothetical protein FD754_010503 [Muntiacus muntjak]KAB0378790.1 hypothetical protein FD755_010368 [Muntiacus reevesi]
MSKVLLHLEITFAVTYKIPSHSFGAYNWVNAIVFTCTFFRVSCLGSEWKRAWSLGQCRRHFHHLTHCKCHVRFHGSIKRSN